MNFRSNRSLYGYGTGRKKASRNFDSSIRQPGASSSRLRQIKSKKLRKSSGLSGYGKTKGKSRSRTYGGNISQLSSKTRRRKTGFLKTGGKSPSNNSGQHEGTTGLFRIEKNGRKFTLSYKNYKVIGNGSFGVVFLCKIVETNTPVAVKKVFQDQRFKNRELQVMKILTHPNIIKMIHYFYSKHYNEKKEREDLYLNLIMEYLPETVYGLCKTAMSSRSFIPWKYVKVFAYQLLRGINYLHSIGICHRDIKPQNLLVDQLSGKLKICDFGSAKTLKETEPNVSYICSRYYRAPELIFGETHYTLAVDTWSIGCVICELISGRPIFPGENTVDQIVKIIKILGTPTESEIKSFNKKRKKISFPDVQRVEWRRCLRRKDFKGNEHIYDLLTQLLRYNPRERVKPIDALAHPFFNELRKRNNSFKVVDLFDFTKEELNMSKDKYLRKKLVPSWFEM